MSDLLAALNPSQKEAVQVVNGPLLVVAGAGTGKTRTLVHRLAYLVTERGFAPRNLLALTFTTRAADEMRCRVAGLCRGGLNLSALWIGTIHALCHELLRTNAGALGLPGDFILVSPSDRAVIIRNCVQQWCSDGSPAPLNRQVQQIEKEKNSVCSYEELSPLSRAYQKALEQKGLLDFEDLILKTLEMFRTVPETAATLCRRFSHIAVDEYQDLNRPQYRLIRSLCAEGAHLWAVGDADQAIYAFRGAQAEIFINFTEDFPAARVVYLENNYRSSETILGAAQQVIAQNRNRLEKRLVPTRPAGAKIQIWETADEQDEAWRVAREIERLLGGTRMETLCNDEECLSGFGDIAVLYRLHAQSQPLKKALQQHGVPVEEPASRGLYEEPIIKPLLDVLEIIRNPHNNFSLEAILSDSPFAIGPATARNLKSGAAQSGVSLFDYLANPSLPATVPRTIRQPLGELMTFLQGLIAKSTQVSLNRLLNDIAGRAAPDDNARHDSIFELLTSAMPFSHVPAAEGIPLFLRKIALLREGETLAPRGEAVRLMTVHGAKGLEFPVVFITGLEEGLFPFFGADNQDAEQNNEEERRLFFVGMTRAQDRLYLLHAQSRFLFGQRKNFPPSRFLEDISAAWAQIRTTKPRKKKRSQAAKQMKLFT